MMSKVGLVIQGPLLSKGRHGGNAHLHDIEFARIGGSVSYDCRENIADIIRDFGSLFDAIVISTWDSELRPKDKWPGSAIISVPDPGGVPDIYRESNKYRQFIGIQNGLKELAKNSRVNYAVRIRTDQYVDLKKLLRSFDRYTRLKNYHSKMIFVPFVQPDLFSVSDFYFAAELQTMQEFCDAFLGFNRYEFTSSIHIETLLKYAYSSFRSVIGAPDWAYFPRAGYVALPQHTKKIYIFMLNNVFLSLSRETFQSLVWRGVLVSKQYTSGKNILFEEDLTFGKANERERLNRLINDSRYNKYNNIPALFSVDWPRYFDFREKTIDVKPSLKEKSFMIVGGVGWFILWTLLGNIIKATRRIALRLLKQ